MPSFTKSLVSSKKASNSEKKRIGLIGSGFISKGLVLLMELRTDLQVHRVLTRSRIDELDDFPRRDLLTNSAEEMIEDADLVDHKVFPLNATPKRGRCISPACTLLKVRTEPNVSAELISRVGAA
jgi:hypothetical protein